MSHTLQTVIAFPIVFSAIVLLLSSGPILYEETADAAAFHVGAIRYSISNRQIYAKTPIYIDGQSIEIVCTSPERMHIFIRAMEDSARILIDGVTSS